MSLMNIYLYLNKAKQLRALTHLAMAKKSKELASQRTTTD
jgi:hypothetical protein